MSLALLTRKGEVILVDNDFPLIDRLWRVANTGYAVRDIGGKQELLHNLVLPSIPGMCRDHINGNKLDNRRQNLRYVTHAQNMLNRAGSSACGIKGVSVHKASGKWQAQIRVGGKVTYLGLFNTPEEAGSAYAEASARYHGEFGTIRHSANNELKEAQ
jgi:hypothetical protein